MERGAPATALDEPREDVRVLAGALPVECVGSNEL